MYGSIKFSARTANGPKTFAVVNEHVGGAISSTGPARASRLRVLYRFLDGQGECVQWDAGDWDPDQNEEEVKARVVIDYEGRMLKLGGTTIRVGAI